LRPPAAGEGGERERERSSDEKEPEQEPDHVDAERRNEEIRRRTRTDDAADSAERVDVSRRFADPLLLGKFGRVGADKSQQVCRRPEEDEHGRERGVPGRERHRRRREQQLAAPVDHDGDVGRRPEQNPGHSTVRCRFRSFSALPVPQAQRGEEDGDDAPQV